MVIPKEELKDFTQQYPRIACSSCDSRPNASGIDFSKLALPHAQGHLGRGIGFTAYGILNALGSLLLGRAAYIGIKTTGRLAHNYSLLTSLFAATVTGVLVYRTCGHGQEAFLCFQNARIEYRDLYHTIKK